MLEHLKELLPAYAAKLACVALICASCRYINSTVSKDVRLRIALWLLGSTNSFTWHQHLPAVFADLFGRKTLSLHAARMTVKVCLLVGISLHVVGPMITRGEAVQSIASAVLVLLTTANDVIGAFSNYQLSERTFYFIGYTAGTYTGLVSKDISALTWLALVAALLIYNLPIEYGTIAKTRWILQLANRWSSSVGKLAVVLGMDVITTALVAAASVAMLSELGMYCGHARSGSCTVAEEAVTRQILVSAVLPFIHTIWMVSYVLMAFISRFLLWVGRKAPLLTRFLSEERIEQEPITLIGELCAAVFLLTSL